MAIFALESFNQFPGLVPLTVPQQLYSGTGGDGMEAGMSLGKDRENCLHQKSCQGKHPMNPSGFPSELSLVVCYIQSEK